MKRIIFSICIGLVLLCGSCIEFESQTLTYKHDHKNDQLLIFQLYEGIFASKKDINIPKKREKEKEPSPSPTEQEIEQLQSVINGQRIFFFANWIFEYNSEMMMEFIDDFTKRTGKAETPEEEAYLKKTVSLLQLLHKHVIVKNGDMFVNDEKKLSAYQYVTVTNISTIIKETNALINAYILHEVAEDVDSENDTLLNTFIASAKKDYTWLTLDQNQIRLTLPVSRTNFARLKKELVADKESFKVIQGFLTNDFWIIYDKEIVTLTLGQPKNANTSVKLKTFEGYTDSLKNYAETQKLIKPKPDLDKLKKAFFEPAN